MLINSAIEGETKRYGNMNEPLPRDNSDHPWKSLLSIGYLPKNNHECMCWMIGDKAIRLEVRGMGRSPCT